MNRWIRKLLIALFFSVSYQNVHADLECKDNSKLWPLFVQTSENNLFEVSFPVKPTLEEDGNTICYIALDSSSFPVSVYGLSYYKNPIESEDPYKIFQEIRSMRSSSYSELLWEKMSVEGDHYILDLISKSRDLKVFRKDRIIVTATNIYSLFTIFFPHSSENHTYFIDSFKLY